MCVGGRGGGAGEYNEYLNASIEETEIHIIMVPTHIDKTVVLLLLT